MRRSIVQPTQIIQPPMTHINPTLIIAPPPPHSVRKNQQIIRKSIVGDRFRQPEKKRCESIVRHRSIAPTKRSIVTSQIPQIPLIQIPLLKPNPINQPFISNISQVQNTIDTQPIVWKTEDGHTC